jgi:hypothetical protein
MISSDPSVWIAAFFTIAIMSYAFRDNIVFEFAEKTFIAAVVGQAVVVGYESLRQFGISQVIAGQYIYIIPIILGFLIFFRYHPQYFWLSRYGTAILVGVGAGLKLRTVPKASIMDQILASVNISQGTALLGIFGADESAEAGDEALEGRHIQLVPPPEGVDDLGPGVALFRVSDVVGQLNILVFRPSLVLPFYAAHIHAH